jgi:mRNA-degrading endonuclease RelE of RelBE toxin-antitoxin system
LTYQVVITAPARRDLNRLPESMATAVCEFLTGALADNPHRVGKALAGNKAGQYSARRGNYRIIYRIVEETIQVQVIRIRYRAIAYRHGRERGPTAAWAARRRESRPNRAHRKSRSPPEA